MKNYLLVIGFILGFCGISAAQSFHEVGLFEPSSILSKVVKVKTHTSTKVKVYQSATNIVKYEIPQLSYVKIGIYDKSSSLVRTYIYNDVKAGTYELSFTSGNLNKGSYTFVLSSAGVNESTVFSIE